MNDVAKGVFQRQIQNVSIPDVEERVNLVFARARVSITKCVLVDLRRLNSQVQLVLFFYQQMSVVCV